jgi:putative transposase
LRTQFVLPTIRAVFRSIRRERSASFRVTHYSIQDNHVHLLVEANDRAALLSGVRSLVVRLARRVNRLLMRRGSVWSDRWHGRALSSPRAVRNALVYVLNNFKKHHRTSTTALDPYSSAVYFTGFLESPARAPPHALPHEMNELAIRPVSAPETWLLQTGWKRHGLLAMSEYPAN